MDFVTLGFIISRGSLYPGVHYIPGFHSGRAVVVGHGSQSMMGLSIDSSSVAMNLRTVRISKSQKKSTTRAGNNKGGSFSVSCDLIILCLHLNF